MRDLCDRSLLVAAFLSLTLLLVPFFPAGAQSQQEPLLLTLTQYRVVEDAAKPGGEVFVPFEGDAGAPGTVIEYQIAVKNVSGQPLSDLLLRLSIPHGTVYLEGKEKIDTAVALLQVSIDDGQTFRLPPIRYTRTNPDGTEEQTIATPDMYTDLRIVFLRSLRPGEEVTFAYRVQIR